MVGRTTVRRTLFVGVLSCFLSGALGGVLPTIRLNTTFELSSCQAFVGSQKQATVLAFCQTIVERAGFQDDPPICNVPASSCSEPARRVLLQTSSSTATISQEGSFGSRNSTEVQEGASTAVANTTAVQENVVQILVDLGDNTTASLVQNTTIEGASSASEDVTPPPNECEQNADCGEYSPKPFCLKNSVPYECVECLDSTYCDTGDSCIDYQCQPS